MFSEVKDSIKAKLYESTSTPFMGSFIISWIFINRMYILIYFGNFEDKLSLLEKYSFGEFYYKMWFAPLIIALAYVYIYPRFLKHFLSYTLEKEKERYDLKQEIEGKKRLTVDQSREMKSALYRLEDELDKKDEKILHYKNEIERLENENSKMNEKTPLSHIIPTFSKEKSDTYEKETLLNKLEKFDDNVNHNDKDKYNINNKIYEKFSNEFSRDEIIILHTIYSLSILGSLSLSGYINKIKKHLDMPTTKIEFLLKELEKKGYIILDDYDQNFDLTEKGKEQVLVMFDNSHI